MNTQTKVSGALATVLVFCAAPIPSQAVTADLDASFLPAVQHSGDTSDLLVLAGERGGGRGGGGARGGGGGGGRAAAPNRGGGGGGAANANRGGGGAANANRAGDRQVRSQATSNVNHNRAGTANVNQNRNINANANRNVSGNRNVNVNNVNVAGDFDRGWNGGWDDDYHPFATAAVVGGTAALVGSMVNSIPPSCTPVVVNGATYSQCGSTWYQPQYAGTSVQYQVVNPPQ